MRLIAFLLCSLTIFGSIAWAGPGDIRVTIQGDTTRIVIETERAVSAQVFQSTSETARKLTIGLDAAQDFSDRASIHRDSGISSINRGPNRLIFTLDRPLHVQQIKELPPIGDTLTHRVIVDLIGVSEVRFDRRAIRDERRLTAWLEHPDQNPVPNRGDPSQFANGTREKLVIVIDAGHGGRDPGTTVSPLVQEKEVVLKTALILEERLSRNPQYDVRLVRSEDVYVDHEDRVSMARDWDADLFISLHADSVGRSNIRGAAVFTLNQKGRNRIVNTSRQNNWEIDLDTEEPVTEDVVGILQGLTIRETLDNSAKFAEFLIPELRDAGPVLRSGHRESNLFVLLAPDVPAVLVELGFLSNSEDARRLASPRGRADAAVAIERAIDKYFDAESAEYAEN